MTGAEGSPERSGSATWQTPLRTIIAIAMVGIASLGACVAHKAALTERDTDQLERVLAQGHLLEIAERQKLLDRLSANALFSERIRIHETLGARLAAEAKGDTPTAARMALQAQEEFSAARALQPFLRVAWNPLEPNLSIEQSLKKRVARMLADTGFETSWKDPRTHASGKPAQPGKGAKDAHRPAGKAHAPAAGPAKGHDDATGSIWAPLTERIHHAHATVPKLALAVTLYVLALVFLTLGDLTSRQMRAWASLGAAVLLTAATSVFVALTERGLVFMLVPIALATVVCAWLAWRFPDLSAASSEGEHLETREVEKALFAGGHLHKRKVHDTFTRNVVLLIAATVLISSVAALLYSRADGDANAAAHDALEQEVEMHSRTTRLSTAVFSSMHQLADIQVARARYAAAKQRAEQLALAGPPAEGEAAYAAAQKRLSALFPLLVTLTDDPNAGSRGDARFPEKLALEVPFLRADNNYYEPFALWDAHRQRSSDLHAKASVYLGTLTYFALALFLFGHAVAMGRSLAGRALAGAGLVLVAIGASWAFSTWAAADHPVNTAPRAANCRTDGDKRSPEAAAARHYSIGKIRLSMARSESEFTAAAEELRCAVAARPDFALAHADLAAALALAASPQANDSYYSMITRSQLAQVLRHREATLDALRRNGYAEPAQKLNSHAIAMLWLSVDRRNLPGLRQTVAFLRRADESAAAGRDALAGLRPLVRLNLGLTLIIAGEEEEGRKVAQSALEIGAADDEGLMINTLTTIDILNAHCKGIHAATRCAQIAAHLGAVKDLLVERTWPRPAQRAAASGDAAPGIEPIAVKASAHLLTWQGRLKSFEAARDRLVVIWSVFDEQWGAWYALPDVSGAVPAGVLARAESGIDNSYFAASSFSRCLGSGNGPKAEEAQRVAAEGAQRVRAEFYLNGKPAGVRETTVARTGATPQSLLDLNLAFCRAADWKLAALPKQLQEEGYLAAALARSGGKPAFFVFTFFAAKPAAGSGERSLAFAERARSLLARHGLVGAADRLVAYDRQARCGDSPAQSGAVAAEWSTSEGMRHVALALPAQAPWAELCGMMASLSNIYRPHAAAAAK